MPGVSLLGRTTGSQRASRQLSVESGDGLSQSQARIYLSHHFTHYTSHTWGLFSERRFSVEMNILLVCMRKGAFSVASRGNNGCGVKPSRLGLESQFDSLLNLGKSLTYLGLH